MTKFWAHWIGDMHQLILAENPIEALQKAKKLCMDDRHEGTRNSKQDCDCYTTVTK